MFKICPLGSKLVKLPMQLIPKPDRLLRLVILAGLGFALGSAPIAVIAQSLPSVIVQSRATVEQQEQRGRELYQLAQFEQAVEVWRQAAQVYQKAGDRLRQARVLNNLSLAYQQLGQWQQAQTAVTESLALLQEAELEESDSVEAQAFNTLGRLQLALGRSEQALSSWQQAIAAYTRSGDELGVLRAQINQAEALQKLGNYQRALKQLTDVSQALQTEPASQLKAVGLRSYGDLLYLVGELERSRRMLAKSLAIARELEASDDVAAALLSLGNVARAQQDSSSALKFYQEAAALPTSKDRQVAIALAQLSLFLDLERWSDAHIIATQIQPQLAELLPSHTTIDARINFAQNLLRLQPEVNGMERTVAETLAVAAKQAKDLGDQKALAYALGFLGQVYAQTEQWSTAQELLEEALLLAQSVKAPDLAYRWQWQLGRVFQAQNQPELAIAAYTEAITILQSLRSELVAVSREVQFSFQEKIEPIYRELVSLLLEPNTPESQQDLAQARDVIESFRVVELDNFLRQACLTAQPVPIEQLDPQAAVIYPIILRDRLEIILSLPDSPLQHYTTSVPEAELEEVIAQLRYTLVIRSRRQFFAPSQQLYDWLIRPLSDDLAQSGVKTLVFVLDGSLRNIPMAALHDGQQYLVEQYGIALSPSLRLLAPKSLLPTQLKTLAAGLTQEIQGFAPLDYVSQELEEIQKQVAKSVILLNQEFTEESLRETIEFTDFPVVHIATHGQFGSSLEQTFILTWDNRINLNELDDILQARTPGVTDAIELLVLSACETAAGDQQAALGLAGVSVQAGARSTAATLWTVNDRATAEFMGQFYQKLGHEQISKAEALRQAQLALIENTWYQHPFYWAPYVLVGNWM